MSDQADPIGDALAAAIDVPFVTHYAAVVAAVMDDGTEITHLVTSPGLPLWMAHGLLSYEAAASTPQPNWMAPDEEEDGDA